MTDREFADRACVILSNMCMEQTGWRSFFRRWPIHHEPLRNDAGRLLKQYGYIPIMRIGTRNVAD